MKHTKQYPGYSPKEFFYGFIGKDFPTKNHFFFEPKDAQTHKKQLSEEIGASETSFCSLKQVHSDKCFIVNDREFLLEEHIGDALATNLKNVILTIQTADCVPVLFFDATKKNVAIAHSGWKGAIGGILQNTVKAMLELGSSIHNIEVIIGPCIKQESYEVDSEFYNRFISTNIKYKKFFIESVTKTHFMFDLPGFVMEILQECKIEKLFFLGENTYNSPYWFSYREDTHKNNKIRRGQNLSFIGIK